LYRYFCIAQQQEVLFLFLIITLYYEYQLLYYFLFISYAATMSDDRTEVRTIAEPAVALRGAFVLLPIIDQIVILVVKSSAFL
jgi:hypothetical protein